MSKRAAFVAVLTAFLVGVLGSLSLRPQTQASPNQESSAVPQIRWRLPVAFGTNLPALGENEIYIQQQIEAVSGGRIRVDLFEPGELISALDIVDSVRNGKVQVGYTFLGYDQGKIPASALFGAVPFGLEPWAFAAWWYEGGGSQLAESVYQPLGVHPLLCGLIGPETAGWFRKPLESEEDIRGLKIRFAGLGGKVLQRMGASVTLLPGGEIFQALERGAIDATEFSLPAVDERLGFQKVARYNYFPGWHQPFTAAHLVVSADAWNRLTDTNRAVIESVCTAAVIRNLARAEAIQAPVLQRYEESGIHTQLIPKPILDALARESALLLQAESDADPDFARVLASQERFAHHYATWRQLAYPSPQEER